MSDKRAFRTALRGPHQLTASQQQGRSCDEILAELARKAHSSGPEGDKARALLQLITGATTRGR